jgi:hypothetical protein
MADTHTRSTTRPIPDQLRFAPGEKVHIGIDTHKRSYHVAVHSEGLGLLTGWIKPADPALLADKLRPHGPRFPVPGLRKELNNNGLRFLTTVQENERHLRRIQTRKRPDFLRRYVSGKTGNQPFLRLLVHSRTLNQA